MSTSISNILYIFRDPILLCNKMILMCLYKLTTLVYMLNHTENYDIKNWKKETWWLFWNPIKSQINSVLSVEMYCMYGPAHLTVLAHWCRSKRVVIKYTDVCQLWDWICSLLSGLVDFFHVIINVVLLDIVSAREKFWSIGSCMTSSLTYVHSFTFFIMHFNYL